MLRVAEHYARSDTGRQRRANEDSYLDRTPLFVIADGMGGARAGEVASRVAVELFENGLSGDGSESAAQRLARRAAEANTQIHALSRRDSRRAGMGTTLTAAHVGADSVSLAHVGDSRAYRLRAGKLERLTEDHSLVSELVRSGRLSEEEAEEHPQRSIITRALGPEPQVEVDTLTVRALHGDIYLLCSDGLTAMVSEARIGEIMRGAGALGEVGRQLVAAANEAGGRDNITVILFRLEDPLGAPAQEPPTELLETVGGLADAAELEPATLEEQGDTQPTARARTPSPPRPRRARSRTPPPPRPRRRRRSRGRRIALRASVAIAIVLALLLAGGLLAGQTIYFISTDGAGQVTVYNGLPYTLPGGIRLYTSYFVSGVTVAELSSLERARLFNDRLRSRADATNLVRELELGQVPGQ